MSSNITQKAVITFYIVMTFGGHCEDIVNLSHSVDEISSFLLCTSDQTENNVRANADEFFLAEKVIRMSWPILRSSAKLHKKTKSLSCC